MISLLTCLAGMVLALVVLDGVTAYVTGETNRGDRIISSFITILILYAIIMGIMSSGAENGFISDGIPFASIMDENTTLTSIMHEHLLTFCKETAALRKNLCKFKNCDKSDILERLGRVDTKPNNASFRQNFTHPALKSLDRRQPACDFLPCLRKIYARKSAYYLSVNTP